MLASRSSRFPPFLVLCAVGVLTIFFYYRASITPALSFSSSSYPIKAANGTLGFGGLFVVSGPGSPRRTRLEQAAQVVELNLTIPDQPVWTQEDVDNFRAGPESQVGLGSALAWMSHHVVLKAFLDSGLESALIFEDDVDFDIRLRTKQVPLAQQAVRTLSDTTNLDSREYPWGAPSDWELLYLGHCGDYFDNIADDMKNHIGVGHVHPDQLTSIPHVIYPDPTMPMRTNLHPYTASLLSAFALPEQQRVIHKSRWPLCTFGYAVTRYSAERLMTVIAPAKEDVNKHIIAYDAALLTGCRDGALKCYTITPELMHHMEGDSIIGALESTERLVFRPPVDEAGLEQVIYRQETSNIGCGFWSGQFYYSNDESKLPYLREEVGRKGRCLKNGRDERNEV